MPSAIPFATLGADGLESPEVVAHVADVAAALNQRLGELALAMRAELAGRITELDGDPMLVDLLGASIEGNVDNILHALRHGIVKERLEPPSAAYEYARRLAQRGVPVNALVRAYRLGQQFLLRQAFDASVSLPADDAVRATAYDRIVTDVFDYIDWMSQGVVAVYEQERESWLANRSNARDAKVRRLLSSDDDDIDAAERTIGYRLRGHHVAVVAWVNEAGAAQDQLSRFTRAIGLLAARIGATAPPLVIGRDRASAWGWIPVASDRRWDPSLVDWTPGAPEDHPVPRLALGGAHSGLPGFRRSHEEALQVHHLGGQQSRATRSVLSYDEPGVGVVALLAQNLDTTRTWVRRVLGDLAVDDDQHERQRQTLLTFLQHDGSYTATADTMLMHKNSIKYRVASAEKMLGHKVTEDRLAIELALLTCHWLGPAVLI